MKYVIKIGHKKDMWFITVNKFIVKIFYSLGKAEDYIENKENEKGIYND